MDRKNALDFINSHDPTFLKNAKVKGQYICPLCGHGKGGDGIRLYKVTQHYKCFGCGESHNTMGWFLINKGLPDDREHLVEGLKEASSYFGIWLEESPAQIPTIRPAITQPIEQLTLPDMTDYFKECSSRLNDTSYLKDRAIKTEICQQFNLGYDPKYKTFNRNDDGSTSQTTWDAIIIPTTPKTYIVRNTEKGVAEKKQSKKNRTCKIFVCA